MHSAPRFYRSLAFLLLGAAGCANNAHAQLPPPNAAANATVVSSRATHATNAGGARNTAPERVLYRFKGGTDGANPASNLITDASGALYGTTLHGGGYGPSGGYGTVFKLTPHRGRYVESILHRFQSDADGAAPHAGLIADAAGALYGTTYGASIPSDYGTVFKLTPSGSGYAESVLYHFAGNGDGAYPEGGVILIDGALYGTTESDYGASGGNGTAYKLTPSGSGYAETVLYRFQNGSDGAYPGADIIHHRRVIYGSTESGGTKGDGTVFSLTPVKSGYVESVLYRFKGGRDGSGMEGSVTLHGGVLYGDTLGGGGAGPGSGYGTVFSLTPSTTGCMESVLYRFQSGNDGAYPNAKPIDLRGTLYGTTQYGGFNGNGTIYKLTPAGTGYAESVVYRFQGASDGAYPIGSLLYKNGALFGTTEIDGNGPNGYGTVFRLAL